jgi:hypothetical protein
VNDDDEFDYCSEDDLRSMGTTHKSKEIIVDLTGSNEDVSGAVDDTPYVDVEEVDSNEDTIITTRIQLPEIKGFPRAYDSGSSTCYSGDSVESTVSKIHMIRRDFRLK